MPFRVCLYRQLYNLTPAGGEVRRVRRLNLRRSDAAYDVGADRRLPIPACGKPGAVEFFAADLLIDFEKAAAGVAWVELHDAEFRLIVLQRLADAELRCAAFAGRVVIALEDDHVAAITATSVEVSSPRSAFANRRHHFEKLIAYREHRILQPEGCDFRVAIGDLKTEHLTNII